MELLTADALARRAVLLERAIVTLRNHCVSIPLRVARFAVCLNLV